MDATQLVVLEQNPQAIIVVKAVLPTEVSFGSASPKGGCDCNCGDDCSCGSDS